MRGGSNAYGPPATNRPPFGVPPFAGMPFTPDFYGAPPAFYPGGPMSPPQSGFGGPGGMMPMPMQSLPPAPFKTDYFPPLDPQRFYLLGQVEYYLSPECVCSLVD